MEGAGAEANPETPVADQSLLQWFYAELTGSYINIFLLCAILYLLYKIIRPSSEPDLPPPPPPLPPLKKQDMTLIQLKQRQGLRRHQGQEILRTRRAVLCLRRARRVQ